ncbi:MAG: tRNA (guanosine(37)-N1)-methyltransferase TrmD [Oscillospiraceae bacterium]|nr:tRNA (guanosine(37)-N1)-methyltransferase TrmD [Oscillospiraceae bacterium]MDE6777204.1 tRNA (guanosine(37)-N1)-methyltransferase TrmD [Oscillospiraceae bacterium]MDE7094584.1 tRNA (guanosine(37)-N1)-methyltransferase TrmD [Oscillospiraceae bacterium]
MIRIDIATLFPEMCETVLSESIIGRARKSGAIEIHCHNIRDYTTDKHRRADDTPYGGGMGMVMKAEPIYRCWQAVCEELSQKPYSIFLSPQGHVLTQAKTVALSKKENLFLLCGHYEGVDQRVLDKIIDEEISIGDYVLTGGELPALVLTDAIARMCPNVLSSALCFEEESHWNGLLEYPQYTKPETWENLSVPSVLLSGHHLKIAQWHAQESLRVTQEKRPDLYQLWIDKN